MNTFAAALMVLFSVIFYGQSQEIALLQKAELCSFEDACILEYDSQLVLIDSHDNIVSIYDIIQNKCIKNNLKNLSKSALESSIIIRTGYNFPAIHITISCDNKKDKTYFVHNGQVLEECPVFADCFICEQEVFTEPDMNHIRIVVVSSKDEKADSYCYVLTEKYLQVSENKQIECWKQKYDLRFSSLLLQEHVAFLAKKCGIKHKIAVYEYTEPENQSYMTFRTGVTFTLDAEKTVIDGTKWIIVINPQDPKDLMTALLYHEMGHIVHKDPEENNRTVIDPARSREREYQADNFLYEQLLKDNLFMPYISFFNFLSQEALLEEDYDEQEAMHPRSLDRASRCLAFIQQYFPLNPTLLQ